MEMLINLLFILGMPRAARENHTPYIPLARFLTSPVFGMFHSFDGSLDFWGAF